MLSAYPQNGDRIVNVDYVTSLHLMYKVKGTDWRGRAHRRFWYQVLTCVSVRLRQSATSARSATLRYFWQPNLRSRYCSWACVNAVRRRRSFFAAAGTNLGSPPPPPLTASSAWSEPQSCGDPSSKGSQLAGPP